MPLMARVGAQVVAERYRPQAPDDPARVPSRVELITPAWMTAALCRGVPGARVLAVHPTDGSSGTTYRRRLALECNDAAREGGVPSTVFTKSAPGALQRMTQSITGPVEARFYLELRPLLEIEAPRCFHGAVDKGRMTAIIVLEDLVATKQAMFLGPTTRVTRPEAEQIIDTLATIHGTFARRSQQAAFAKTYQEMWQDALALMGIERYFLRCFDEAGELLAPELRRDPRRAWNAVLRSIALHDGRPATLLHNDVHLGNWYRTAEGRMGLCDWQAVVRGHWSRDLAYALATTLTVEDRRAWEDDLVARYVARRTDTSITHEEAWRGYREQVWGALAFWAPTYSPPRLMPSDMQPRAVSGELLRRISAACVDLDAFEAVAVK
jgi:Phosphotransferase enzyme family